jgi:hypothetical protein
MTMKLAEALLARFRLITEKEAGQDQFDQRLQRIGRREKGHKALPVLFKNQPSHQEA